MELARAATSETIGVLVADSNQMQRQLLVSALRRRAEFRVTACSMEMDAMMRSLANSPADVILVNTNSPKLIGRDMASVRRLHLAYPQLTKVLMLEASDR
jgi:PleD family two-component response regulator